jgi:hypothetical protein
LLQRFNHVRYDDDFLFAVGERGTKQSQGLGDEACLGLRLLGRLQNGAS